MAFLALGTPVPGPLVGIRSIGLPVSAPGHASSCAEQGYIKLCCLLSLLCIESASSVMTSRTRFSSDAAWSASHLIFRLKPSVNSRLSSFRQPTTNQLITHFARMQLD
ncbi:hypothetical protein BO86DRAFT_103336 [Aspergillus japonicus CBS 114.51]|uniref:Uncharacterized protein n=1 Tax=Aspergillus japonicus CBS 114.51 TaxID=1448312 RepID=A0A8T8WZG8_ASPJA|nr:hypothetical protein BO86DRAFT_103336 [Aspergillus japonicus CBS 114.51]RAH81258.1 hypothetical protein BO86DRAFT_103336 [Aspergillus japonicus CBS 114.51]